MTEANEYECEISKSWALIDLNLNEESPVLFDSQNECKPLYSVLPEKAQKVNLPENSKSEKLLDGSEDSNILCNNKFDSNKHSPKLEVTNENVVVIQDVNSNDDSDNNSDDSDSIEVLDFDKSYQESNDHLNPLENNSDFDEVNELNFKKFTKNEDDQVSEDDSFANLGIIRKRIPNVSNVASQSDPSKTNNHCESVKKDLKDLRVAIYKSRSPTIYDQCYSKIKNIAINLLLGIFFAGIVCITIGHVLGIQNSSTATNKTVKVVDEISPKLAQISAVLVTKEKNSTNQDLFQLYERIRLKKSNLVTTSNEVCSVQNISQPTYFSQFMKNLVESKAKKLKEISSRHLIRGSVPNFNNLFKYIYYHLNFLNINYKELKVKCLNELNPVIFKVLQSFLLCLSSHNNTSKFYEKLDEIISEDKFNIDAYIDHIKNEKNFIQINRTALKLESSVEKINFQPAVMYTFPQREAYYMNEENSTAGVNHKNSDLNTTNGHYNSPKTFKNKKEFRRNKLDGSNIQVKNNQNMNDKNVLNQRESKKKRMHPEKKQKRTKTNKKGKKRDLKKSDGDLRSKLESKVHSGEKKKVKSRVQKSKHLSSQKTSNFISSKENKFQEGKSFTMVKNVPSKQIDNKEKVDVNWQFKRAKSRKQFRHDNSGFTKKGDWFFKWANGRDNIRKEHCHENWQFERAEARKRFRNDFSFFT